MWASSCFPGFATIVAKHDLSSRYAVLCRPDNYSFFHDLCTFFVAHVVAPLNCCCNNLYVALTIDFVLTYKNVAHATLPPHQLGEGVLVTSEVFLPFCCVPLLSKMTKRSFNFAHPHRPSLFDHRLLFTTFVEQKEASPRFFSRVAKKQKGWGTLVFAACRHHAGKRPVDSAACCLFLSSARSKTRSKHLIPLVVYFCCRGEETSFDSAFCLRPPSSVRRLPSDAVTGQKEASF